MRRLMPLRNSGWVCALLIAIVLSRSIAAAAPADSDRIVVMISLDGLAAYYLDDPKAEMPTLRASRRPARGAEHEGVHADRHLGQSHDAGDR